MANELNNVVIDGLGGDLLVTEGFGEAQILLPVVVETGPGAPITDYQARAESLLITEFRQIRDGF